jgi:hypothetical protein
MSQLIDIRSVDHAVKYAQKIARKMSKDPEVDSVAGEAAWRALYTYDVKRNVKLSWWIAHLTKQGVQYYWRSLNKLREREKLLDELWWMEQSDLGRVPRDRGRQQHHYEEDNLAIRLRKDDESLDVDKDTWQLLVESFILKWPLDVIARERGVSIHAARAMRTAAISRMEAAAC